MNKLEDKLKIGVSVIAGGLAVYGLESFRVTDQLIKYEIGKASYLGEGYKNFVGYIAPVTTRLFIDGGIGILCGLLTHEALSKLKDRGKK